MQDNSEPPSQHEQNRQAFLRYLPRRIADFERRILRYRFAGWDPKSMVVLSGDAHRLAEASSNYALDGTRDALLALAWRVSGFAASMRGPDPKQTEGLFALLSAVLRSLPAAPASAAPATLTPIGDAATATESGIANNAESTDTSTAPDAGDATSAPGVDAAADAAELDAEIIRAATGDEVATHAGAATASQPIESSQTESIAAEPVLVECIPAGSQRAESIRTEPAPAEPDLPHHTPSAAESTIASGDETTNISAPAANATGTPRATAARFDPAGLDDAEELDVAGDGGMRRIFHFSDGNAFAHELGARLEAQGHAVESVESIEELSEMLTCLMPHMLLVDASQASRLGIVGALRRDAQHHAQPPRHIQMILMAPQDTLEVRRAAYRAGADLLLFPPFDAAGVAERLHALHAASAAEPVRVLVVDDQRADALFAQAVLARAGMRARVEHDPMRVADALAAEHADLILMDLHMPFANGVEVTMLLRDDPQFARIPIVFLSGESDPDSRLEAINAGGDDFLFKPIRPRHLVAAVRDRVRRLHAVEKVATTN
ncbi:MAG: response regulator [Proteobacteria bacterium]|nr:response regulator [Pseudomonadota bacterium]